MAHAAAVILTHGEHETYKGVLSDLLAQGMARESICVVHNPVRPTDRSPEPGPGVEVLRMEGNLGYAVAMNAGMTHQLERGHEWIWLLTHDVRLRPGAFDAMLSAAADGSGRAGALGPLLANTGTDVCFSLGGERTRWGLPYNTGYGGTMGHDVATAGATRQRVWLDGSSIMLRAEALRQVGLYDTSLFGYTEDADLCLRLERAGWDIRVVNAAVAEQTAGNLSRPGPVTFLLARNNLRYIREVAGATGVFVALAHHARDSARWLRATVTGPDRRVAAIRCLATWVGVVAFMAGRTGAPPTWLPGRGDSA